ERDAAKDAREIALERVSLLGADGPAYREAQKEGKGEEFLNNIINQERAQLGLSPLGASSASTTTSVDISGINPTAVQNLRENPTAQNRAYFDQAFGVGSAAAVLGQ
ncbi:MAG: hypothetical protein CMA72_00965, partial [Euryarchaeota archaeon]|nr:hypothetical protein [Euryarchaeota archaeon]